MLNIVALYYSVSQKATFDHALKGFRMEIILDQIQIGPMKNFQYFIGCSHTRQVAVVDPAWQAEMLLDYARDHDYTIARILLTHGHPDHCDSASQLTQTTHAPVMISQDEASFYIPDCLNLEAVKDGQVISIGTVTIECLLTPGHTPGCLCFKCGDILLTGDTLFINGCGRTDLPGGDASALYHSLYDVLLKLPDSTLIYPGHQYGGKDFDTLGNQRHTNPYLTCRSEREFLEERMGY